MLSFLVAQIKSYTYRANIRKGRTTNSGNTAFFYNYQPAWTLSIHWLTSPVQGEQLCRLAPVGLPCSPVKALINLIRASSQRLPVDQSRDRGHRLPTSDQH